MPLHETFVELKAFFSFLQELYEAAITTCGFLAGQGLDSTWYLNSEREKYKQNIFRTSLDLNCKMHTWYRRRRRAVSAAIDEHLGPTLPRHLAWLKKTKNSIGYSWSYSSIFSYRRGCLCNQYSALGTHDERWNHEPMHMQTISQRIQTNYRVLFRASFPSALLGRRCMELEIYPGEK